MTGCYWPQDSGTPRCLQRAEQRVTPHGRKLRVFCSDWFPETVSHKIKGLENLDYDPAFPIPGWCPSHHTDSRSSLRFDFCPMNIRAVAADGGAGEAGEESGESFLPRKGVLFAGLCEKSSGSWACLWVCSGMQSTVLAPGCPSPWHPACQQLPAPRGYGSKAQVETLFSPPGRAHESQRPTQGLASTPETNHFQLRTKPNRTQPPGPCISMGKMS